MTMNFTEIQQSLRRLRLSGMSETLETRALQADQGRLPFLDAFATLIQDEIDRRDTKSIDARFRKSGLDERKHLNEIDWGFNHKLPRNAVLEMFTLKFLTQGQNAILIGNAGTGKSHIAKALALAALKSGYSVVYRDAQDLVIASSEMNGSDRKRMLKAFSEADLFVIDDLFLRKLPPNAVEEIQEVIFVRYRKHRSTVITSNRVLEDWAKLLGDAAATSAILDRLMHRCKMLDFEGPSWRLKESAEAIAKRGRSR
jgi:DNA replication protein DnaC